MGYRMMGRAHAALVLMGGRLREQSGQGTVEYVALILLVAAPATAAITVASSRISATYSTVPWPTWSRSRSRIDTTAAWPRPIIR